MNKFIALALAGCMTLSSTITASAALEPKPMLGLDQITETILQNQSVENPDLILNDQGFALGTPIETWGDTLYVSYWPLVQALYPDAVVAWNNDRAVVAAQGLNMEIIPGKNYFMTNGRYFYLEQGVKTTDNVLLLPLPSLCGALGASLSLDQETGLPVVTAGDGPIASADAAYPEDVLYWLSHIINAEAGNQPLDGKIAVGNVILNRVSSSLFPNTVYEVIFQQNQFTPVANGSIHRTPNMESIIAAKLVLDGANTVDNALFFMNPKTASSRWMARNRTYMTTIGQHAFYA